MSTNLFLLVQFSFDGWEYYGKHRKAANWCYNNNHKVVEIFGYAGHKRADEFIMNVIENIGTLEKIIIIPHDWCPFRVADTIEECIKYARVHTRKELKPKVPSTIAFILL